MQTANPYLNFAGNTEEVFEFYRSVFGGDFQAVIRFRDFDDNPMGIAEEHLDKIAHIALPLGPNNLVMATDTLPFQEHRLNVGNNFYINLDVDSEEEADRLFGALSRGGKVEMPLQPTPWAEKYGTFADRYGVQWMVNYTGSVQFPAGAAD